jgi:hypothetical protein
MRVKQLACEICYSVAPVRSIIHNNDEVIDICRLCWEDMLNEAGDE